MGFGFRQALAGRHPGPIVKGYAIIGISIFPKIPGHRPAPGAVGLFFLLEDPI
jgi:hypothetical protein